MRKCTCYLSAHLIIAILAIGAVPVEAAATITSISQNGSTIGRFEKFELTFTVSENYTNPFDTDIVDIMAVFTRPDGNTVDVPAFFYKEYDENGSGYYVNERNPCWKVRFSPAQLGAYEINQITIIDDNGTSTIDPQITFTCIDTAKKGIIRVDSQDPCYMRYDTGETYKPIGHNVCWWNENGTHQWKDTFQKMGNAGENWTRIWMTHFWQGTTLEWRSNKTYYNGVGNLSMPIAWRLDRIIESCEQNDVSIQLVLQHHGQFSTSTNANWDDNPYNSAFPADGGFLDDPNEFFTNAEAKRITKYKYRYIVARWGYSPAILAWELFNEVQYTDGWNDDQASVVNWHGEMAEFIHDIDPFQHPVTTSSHGSGFENIWALPDIDLVEVHYYGTDTIKVFEQTALGLASFNKPVIMGEFGTGTESQNDPEGLELHNGIWSTLFSKSSAHLWWWDNFIDPCNLYGVFTPLAIYAENENPAKYNLSRTQRAASGNEAYFASPVLSDFWAETTQFDFYQQDDYFPGMENLSRWLHGSTKSDYSSDPNFHLNMPSAGYLKIHVQATADWTSNSLRVLVNGGQVFSGTYPADSNNFVITVPLSAGQQSVQIENTGPDWFNISSYEFTPGNVSPLDSIGLSNNERAYIWIYDVNSQIGRTPTGTFHNEPVIVKGLDNGIYNVRVYATRGAGGVVDSGQADSVSGVLTYTLPDFDRDIAVKIKLPCIVGLDDVAAMSSQWLQAGPNLAGGSNVDFDDFSVLAGYWMGPCPDGWPF